MAPIRSLTLAAFAVCKAFGQADCSGEGTTWGPGIGPPPAGCGQGGGTGGGDTGGPGGTAECTNPTCSSPPCKAALLGDVGCTTVSGTETYGHELVQAGGTIAANAHIYGPFEAGFTSMQDNIISNWGCSDPSVVYDTEGGKDIGTAEGHVAYACSVELPRIVGNTYYGVVGPCGGHTGDYHFHRSFSCLYSASGGHSTKVGVVTGYNIYGKWEDFANNKLPLLDACGAHFGPTPESPSTPVYHYHVQDTAPFTVGCYGPSASGGLVSLAVCRSLYPECSSNTPISVTLKTGTIQYVRFCPCFDATGSNVGTQELPALSSSEISYTAGSTPTGDSTTTGDDVTTTTESTAEVTTTTSASEVTTTTESPSDVTTTTGSPSDVPTTTESPSDVTTTTGSPSDVTTTTTGSPSDVTTTGSPTDDTTTGSPSDVTTTRSVKTDMASTSSGRMVGKVGWLLGAVGCLNAVPEGR